MIRMFEQLPVKIEHVPVRVALAEDRDEAEDVALESEAFTVRLDEPLARDFRRAVERSLDRKCRILGRGNHRRLAVHRAGRGKRDALDSIRAHRFEHVESGDGVLVKILRRMIGAEAHVGICREVDHEIAASHRLRQRIRVEAVATAKLEARLLLRRHEELLLTRGKIIPADDLPAEREQPIRGSAADETGGSCDEDFLHGIQCGAGFGTSSRKTNACPAQQPLRRARCKRDAP